MKVSSKRAEKGSGSLKLDESVRRGRNSEERRVRTR